MERQTLRVSPGLLFLPLMPSPAQGQEPGESPWALETVASSFPGVEKSFAIQAGREVRIMVKPQDIDDLSIVTLARDIVKKIEESLAYPGQIKVTVIRETRAVDYAK